MLYVLSLLKQLLDFFLGDEPQHKLYIILGVSALIFLFVNCYLWALALGII